MSHLTEPQQPKASHVDPADYIIRNFEEHWTTSIFQDDKDGNPVHSRNRYGFIVPCETYIPYQSKHPLNALWLAIRYTTTCAPTPHIRPVTDPALAHTDICVHYVAPGDFASGGVLARWCFTYRLVRTGDDEFRLTLTAVSDTSDKELGVRGDGWQLLQEKGHLSHCYTFSRQDLEKHEMASQPKFCKADSLPSDNVPCRPALCV